METQQENLLMQRYAALEKELASKNRELEIEAALERVRAKAMAMQKSEELQDVVNTLFESLQELDIQADSANIAIFKDGTRDYDYWVGSNFQTRVASFHMPYTDLLLTRDLIAARESGIDFHAKAYSFEQKNEWFNFAFTNTDFKFLSEDRKGYILAARGISVSIAFGKNTGVQMVNYSGKLPSEIEADILKRFSKVFEQSYTRFLDLQKAEAQAKEAQIEAALERVRARTMAMHKSTELLDVINVVYEQLVQLHFKFDNVSLGTNNQAYDVDFWMAAKGQPCPLQIHAPYIDNPLINHLREARNKGLTFFTDTITPQENRAWILHTIKSVGKEVFSEATRDFLLNSPGYSRSTVLTEDISFFIGNYAAHPYSDEENNTFSLFANVIGQSYTRFLDLQKAEAQAREARIEAALERVRGRAMAMQNSNDLSSTASTVFTELRKLGINPIRCGVGLLSKDSRKAQLYAATSAADGDGLSLIGWVILSGHAVLENIYGAWLKNEDYYPELSGEQLKSYYELLLAGLSVTVPNWQSGEKQFGHFISFSIGCLYAWSEVPYNDAEIKILKRFATIIDLTFRRYLDLQKAEASAREAVKQAALDSIRADIASMRSVSDLDRITPLIWHELTVLGVPFIRCGVFIMDDAQQLIHTFLSAPDGKAIAAFHLPYNTPGSLQQVVEHWHHKKVYTDHWDRKTFTSFADNLVSQGALASTKEYLNTLPPEGFCLHFLPFLQGMFYVGNTDPLPDEQLQLIQLVADAFSTAYARYEDFKKLEAAKQQVDKTLVELKQAQQQLVQSEKMASLGELTAGIAHEIQNPLNFVKNFAEMNMELLEEWEKAQEQGNGDDVKAIVLALKTNEEKISQHGKRADNIVKGMLQHARASTGKKELTDINQLADEYLRLNFQGMRAKEKAFTASLQTNFDDSINKVAVVPQDIGRVLLNLFTNAFYAVTEKKHLLNGTYEPTVWVSTKKEGNSVLISVKDNGTGMSQKVAEKIFQPFFTTKPAGKGTGLGLSLSYDIITKGHGGELTVTSKEGEFSEFVVRLPV